MEWNDCVDESEGGISLAGKFRREAKKKQQQINKQSGGGSVGGDVRERKKRAEMRRQSLVCDSEQCRKMSGGEDGGRLICSRTKRWVTLNMMDQPSFEEEINNAGHDLKSTDSSYDKRLSSSLTKKIDKFKVIIKYKTEKTQKKSVSKESWSQTTPMFKKTVPSYTQRSHSAPPPMIVFPN